jgi:tight adherence protein C
MAPVMKPQTRKDEVLTRPTWTEEHTADLVWMLRRGASLTRVLGLWPLARGLAHGSQVEETRLAIHTGGLFGLITLEETIAGQVGIGLAGVIAWLVLANLVLLNLGRMISGLQCLVLLLCPVLWSVGYLVAGWLLRDRAAQRRNEIIGALSDATDLLVIGLEAGLPFADALQVYAERFHDPLADEFRATEHDLAVGRSRAEALRNMAERTRIDDLERLVNVVLQAEKFGVPIARVLREQRKELKLRREQWVRERTLGAPVKIAVVTSVLMLPAMLLPLLFPVAVNFMTLGLR